MSSRIEVGKALSSIAVKRTYGIKDCIARNCDFSSTIHGTTFSIRYISRRSDVANVCGSFRHHTHRWTSGFSSSFISGNALIFVIIFLSFLYFFFYIFLYISCAILSFILYITYFPFSLFPSLLLSCFFFIFSLLIPHFLFFFSCWGPLLRHCSTFWSFSSTSQFYCTLRLKSCRRAALHCSWIERTAIIDVRARVCVCRG